MVLLCVCHSSLHDPFSIPLHRSSDRPTLPLFQKKKNNHMQSPSTEISIGSKWKVWSCSSCSRPSWKGHDMDKLKQREEGPLDRFQTGPGGDQAERRTKGEGSCQDRISIKPYLFPSSLPVIIIILVLRLLPTHRELTKKEGYHGQWIKEKRSPGPSVGIKTIYLQGTNRVLECSRRTWLRTWLARAQSCDIGENISWEHRITNLLKGQPGFLSLSLSFFHLLYEGL